MADCEDGWDLFGGDDGSGLVANADTAAETKHLCVAPAAAGVLASEHPYFSAAPAATPGFSGTDEELCEALEEYVPIACDMLASVAGKQGRALASSLRRVTATFVSLVESASSATSNEPGSAKSPEASGGSSSSTAKVPASIADCERLARRCAADAWRLLQSGTRQEAVIHAHAFAHAIVAAALLIQAKAASTPTDSSVTKQAMRHADLALLLCTDLPIPALHAFALRCDRACLHGLRSSSDLPDDMVIADSIRAAPKAPSISRPIQRRKFADCSVARFREELLSPAQPAVLEGHVDAAAWAATSKWRDLRFWVDRHGHRSVPVELGFREDDAASGALSSSAEAEGSMLMVDFVERYLIPSNRACSASSQSAATTSDAAEASMIDEWSACSVAYVAQHLLLVQIPELREDISVPHYCALGELRTANVWMGTAGTVTALHYDEDDNFLVQVAGLKYVRLYAYSESERLYATEAPRDNAGHGASFSPVRAEHPDLQTYPEFAKATYEETILAPGEMLFIPRRTWHYVRSLTTSISVNFWF